MYQLHAVGRLYRLVFDCDPGDWRHVSAELDKRHPGRWWLVEAKTRKILRPKWYNPLCTEEYIKTAVVDIMTSEDHVGIGGYRYAPNPILRVHYH